MSAWAKTGRDPLDRTIVTHWLPLHQHLADTAGVAGLLVERWVSPQVVDRIADDLGGSRSEVGIVAASLAAVHDVGKVSPAFVVQDRSLADAMRPHGLSAAPALEHDPARSRVRHEFVGQRAVREFLTEELGLPRRGVPAQLSSVLGAHHGVPVTPGNLGDVVRRPDLAGTGSWTQARSDVLRWATDLVGAEETLRGMAGVGLGRPSQALLTAIVIMADWIASNADLFPLQPLFTPSGPDPHATADRVERGWAALRLPTLWSPRPIADVETNFAQRVGKSPHPVQVAAVRAALDQTRPGMLIVEAAMGEGERRRCCWPPKRCGSAMPNGYC